jgi:hypothetical protein
MDPIDIIQAYHEEMAAFAVLDHFKPEVLRLLSYCLLCGPAI